MDRLVDAVAAALAIGDPAQTCAGQQSDAARDNTGLVADDITEEVARDDDAIERARLLHQQHGGAVDQVVADLELGELVGDDVGDGLAPQPRCCEHVGLVQRPHRQRGIVGQREVRGEPRDALNLRPRVRLNVPCDSVAVVLLAVAEVDAPGELAHHDNVHAAADVRFQGGEVDQRLGGEVARPDVPVRAHLLAEREEALLRPHLARSPFGAADGAQEDGVGSLGGVESFGSQGFASGIDRGLQIVRLWVRGRWAWWY